MARRRIVLISDSHVTSGCQGEADFRAMLELLSGTDFDILFLGDIMDLWIAKDGYEDALQQWFMEWCKAEKSRRSIVFVEGNHEFFVADRYDGVIGTVRKNSFLDGALYCEHGHNILGRSLGFNRLFIAFCKSAFSSFILNVLPCGQRLALWVKRRFGSNGRTFFSGVPDDIVCAWAEHAAVQTGAKDIFIGHFHNARHFSLSNDVILKVLPAWKNNQEVMVFEPDSRRTVVCNWRELVSHF